MTSLKAYSIKSASASIIAALSLSLSAGELDLGGEIGAASQYFATSPRYSYQDESHGWSAFAQPELSWSSGHHQLRFEPFYRYDSIDDERSHGDLREAYWRISSDNRSVLAGVQQVFWGVTESRHLVDVINQTDLVENVDQEDKLGQPMLQFTQQTAAGELSLFWLPYFRERNFPGDQGRFGFPLPVDQDEASYENGAEQKHSDWALRYSHFLGDWDIGLHLFRGTSREPALIPNNGELYPYYAQMRQAGLDLQYTREAWLFKGEMIVRDTQGSSFAAAVLGVEYTLFGFAGGNADVGLLAEYLYDDREDFHPPTPFDDDIFLGTRLAFNDLRDSSALFGLIHDPSSSETFFSLEASTRLGEAFRLDLEARWITGANSDEALYSFANDDYVRLNIGYFF